MTAQYVSVTSIAGGCPIYLLICLQTGHAVASGGSLGPTYPCHVILAGIAAERIGLGQVVEIDGGRGTVAIVILQNVGMAPAGALGFVASALVPRPVPVPARPPADALIADAMRSAGCEPKPAYEPDKPADFDPDHLWKITTGGAV